MRFTPWQMVAVLAILLAAIILAHVFAPGAVGTIVSMATTIFAALFVQRRDDDVPPPGSPPALRVIAGGAALALSAAMTFGRAVACSEGLKSIDEVNDPSDDVKLSKCRADARAEKQLTGNAERAWNVYLACTRDAHRS